MGPALRLAFAIFALALPISAASAQKEPLGGQPARGAKPSVADLEEQLVYQRAFEAVIWSQPLIGLYGITRALREVGIADNEILAMSRPATTRHELITANNTTP